VRVLDFGCGRGVLVARLRQLGHEAYGVDICESYIRSAAAYFPKAEGFPAISLIAGGRTMFPPGFFDVVMTNQVLEHVQDLDAVVAEIGRITAPGGQGLHILPARLSLIEPHMFLPMVHWVPKGPLRSAAIAAALRIGAGARYFTDRPVAERIRIFDAFSHSETFYRGLPAFRRAFRRHGLEVRNAALDKLRLRPGRLRWLFHLPSGPPLAQLYSIFHQLYFVTSSGR
jgi:SAM-dependent methyltransferase